MHISTLNAVFGLTIAFLAPTATADTEIRNFRLPLSTSALPTDHLPALIQLDSSTRQITLNVSASAPELYVQLGLDEGYDSWTVRLSWPGSSPTKFDLSLHPLSPVIDRTAILRISAKPLSIPIPIYPVFFPLLSQLSTLLHPRSANPPAVGPPPVDKEWTTTFHLVLEPLILGVLPRTAIPAIYLIMLFGAGAACCVPHIIRLLEGIQRGPEAKERKAQ